MPKIKELEQITFGEVKELKSFSNYAVFVEHNSLSSDTKESILSLSFDLELLDMIDEADNELMDSIYDGSEMLSLTIANIKDKKSLNDGFTVNIDFDEFSDSATFVVDGIDSKKGTDLAREKVIELFKEQYARDIYNENVDNGNDANFDDFYVSIFNSDTPSTTLSTGGSLVKKQGKAKTPDGCKFPLDVGGMIDSAEVEYSIDGGSTLQSALEKVDLSHDDLHVSVDFSDGDVEAMVEVSGFKTAGKIRDTIEKVTESLKDAFIDEIILEMESDLTPGIIDSSIGDIAAPSERFISIELSNYPIQAKSNSANFVFETSFIEDEINDILDESDEISTHRMGDDIIEKSAEILSKKKLEGWSFKSIYDSSDLVVDVDFGDVVTLDANTTQKIIMVVSDSVHEAFAELVGTKEHKHEIEVDRIVSKYISKNFPEDAVLIESALRGVPVLTDEKISSIESDSVKSSLDNTKNGSMPFHSVTVSLSDDMSKKIEDVTKIAQKKALENIRRSSRDNGIER